MKQNFVWGTHVEILAAAVSFRKPVFTAVHQCINDVNCDYNWVKYDQKPQSNLVYPTNALSFTSNQDVGHLEICLEMSHYDVVVMTDGSIPYTSIYH